MEDFHQNIQQLIEIIRDNTAVLKGYLENSRKTSSPWVGPDEAAKILGLRVTKSRSHRPRVAALVRKGLLTKIRDGRPPAYWREEVVELAEKVAAGKVAI